MPIVGKGKSSKKTKVEPSRQDMHAVVVEILKEVDFNKVSNISVQFITSLQVKIFLILLVIF
jgi:hypothetical protein